MKSLQTGITSVSRGPVDFAAPPTEPKFQYGLAFPFQVAPRLAAVFCNVRSLGTNLEDFDFGTDVILFDNLERTGAAGAVPVSRSRKWTDPKTGRRRIANQGPIIGGFVPLGAKRADGSPHPHAGTGFGVAHVIDFPMRDDGLFDWNDAFVNELEVQQFAYDGKNFRSLKLDRYTPEQPLKPRGSDWRLFEPPMTNAIADGDGLLLIMLGIREKSCYAGVARWEYRDGWEPVSFNPITPPSACLFDCHWITEEAWSEISMVRDVDGSLLAHVDVLGNPRRNSLWLWRSTDNGKTWKVAFELPGLKREGPALLNLAADGTPYIIGNFPRVGRDLLCIWPLNEARDGIAGLVVARDAADEWGQPPGAAQWYIDRANGIKATRTDVPDRPNRWWLDHANGVTVQLADGQWHHVLGYRVITDRQASWPDPPTPRNGAYLEEVFSKGPPVPTWTF